MWKRSDNVKQTDKQDCFAYRERGDGIKMCAALKEKQCYECSFYKNKKAYIKQLRECEERNKELGLYDKYPVFDLYVRK